MRYDGVAQGAVRVELVAVATSFANVREIAGRFKVGNDTLNGALGDSDPKGHLALPNLPLSRNAEQDVRVIAQEGPIWAVDHFPDYPFHHPPDRSTHPRP
jgi:hypothetical protein